MTLKRLLTQIRFWSFGGNGYKRADYARKRGIYAKIGEKTFIPTALPLYPQLIRIHNNVLIHRTVSLVTHDLINDFLMEMPNSYQFKHGECLCPIEIFDNVYIGMNSIIMGNVRIGPNVVINAGSLVTSDIPPNSIVGGVPAKVLGPLDRYVKIRIMMDRLIPYEFHRSEAEAIDRKTVELAWKQFDSRKKGDNKEKNDAQEENVK